MRVSDLMSRDVVTIDEGQTCLDAVERMGRTGLRHLPVLDSEGALVGIVTERDVRQRLFAPDVYGRVGRVPVATLLREAPVRQVLSAPVLSIGPGAELIEAAERMRAAKVGSLVVLDGGKVVGILTEIDLLRHMCGAQRDPRLDIIVSYP
jgi:CBS domain-containing protein